MSSFPVPDSPKISTVASVGAIHFASEVVVFLFELLLKSMDLFESPSVRDRDSGLIGK